MKHSMFIITSMFIFLGCSQESSEKKSATVIKVEKEVPKKVDKDSALICIDSDKKITCKLLTKRVNKEREVEFYWQSPMGKDDRERKMILPAITQVSLTLETNLDVQKVSGVLSSKSMKKRSLQVSRSINAISTL